MLRTKQTLATARVGTVDRAGTEMELDRQTYSRADGAQTEPDGAAPQTEVAQAPATPQPQTEIAQNRATPLDCACTTRVVAFLAQQARFRWPAWPAY